MENIRKAVEDKHAKELSTKKQLESAQGAFTAYKQKLVEMRRDVHAKQQEDFANSIGDKCKVDLLDQAKRALQIIQVKRDNEEIAAKRKQRALEIQAKEKAEGKGSHYDNDTSGDGWGRGTKIAEASAAAAEFDNRMRDRGDRPKRPEDNNNFSRGEQINKAEPREDRLPRK